MLPHRTLLSNREVVNKVRAAFLPFRCVPQISNDQRRLHFRVLRHNGTSVTLSGIPLQQAREERLLDGLLRQVREKVQATAA